jgi:diketogulonate reductase-like aldo/keto reductase
MNLTGDHLGGVMQDRQNSFLAVVPKLPPLLYGTAWKEEKTASLTETALKSGFVAVDAANYPTGYREALVGDGITAAFESGIKREDVFVRTETCSYVASCCALFPLDFLKTLHAL